MPNPDVSIEFDKDKINYRPGELLAGRVYVRVEEPLTVLGIHVSFKGNAFVQFSHGTYFTAGGLDNHIYIGRDGIVNTRWNLYGTAPSATDRPTLTMAKGDHTFQFGFTIPLTRTNGAPLPGSMNETQPDRFNHCHRSKAKIRYVVECHVERPALYSATEVSRDVQLLRSVDLNQIPGSAEAQESHTSNNVACCCCGGPVDVVLKTDKSGYLPGESIRVSATIVNNSPKDVKEATLTLVKTVTYVSNLGQRREDENVLSTIDRGSKVKSKRTHDFGVREVQLPRGLEPTSTPESCSVLYTAYAVWMEVSTTGCTMSFKVKLPITVGSIPEEEQRSSENPDG